MAKLDKRTLFFNIRSLEKFGEENIKILELTDNEKLVIFKPSKTKIMAVFDSYPYLPYATRIVIYNLAKKEVEINKTFDEVLPQWPLFPINVSDEFDICAGNKILKYNKELKDYEKIEIGDYNPFYVYWTRKPIKAYIFSLWPNNALIIYDKQTNNLTYFENILPYFLYEPIILEKENKAYVGICADLPPNIVREINLTNGEYVDYTLPISPFGFLVVPNPLRFYCTNNDGDIFYYNSETEEFEILYRLREEYGANFEVLTAHADVKYNRLFIIGRERPKTYCGVLFVYDVEKNTLERIGIFEDGAFYIKPTKHKDIVIVCDYGYRLVNCKIVDIKKKQIITTLYSDDIIFTSEDIVDIL